MTINKTFDMDHNTETLKRLSNTNEKPNNQVKLANVGAAALPPGNIKCNILKGKVKYINNFAVVSYDISLWHIARVEEELGASGNAKLTNQMFVPAAHSSSSNVNNNNNMISSSNHTHSDGPDSLNATYISVVSLKLKTSYTHAMHLFHAFCTFIFYLHLCCVHLVFCVLYVLLWLSLLFTFLLLLSSSVWMLLFACV